MKYINIDELIIDENQPRKQFNEEEINNLACSMTELNTILQPIIIDNNNKIIDGERRYRAAKIANITNIPCYIINDIPNNKIELVQLIANSNRTNLSGIELAQSIKNILELGVINKQDVAKLLNKQPSYVSRLIAMLSDEWLPIVKQGLISSPNALEALKSLPKIEQDKLIEEAKKNGTAIRNKDINNLKKLEESTDTKNYINDNIITNPNSKKYKVKKAEAYKILQDIGDEQEIEIIIL